MNLCHVFSYLNHLKPKSIPSKRSLTGSSILKIFRKKLSIDFLLKIPVRYAKHIDYVWSGTETYEAASHPPGIAKAVTRSTSRETAL